jgi:hypothetical protein
VAWIFVIPQLTWPDMDKKGTSYVELKLQPKTPHQNNMWPVAVDYELRTTGYRQWMWMWAGGLGGFGVVN